MESISQKVSSFCLTSIFVATCGGLVGYGYGKYFHFPPSHTALNWSIFAVASFAFQGLTGALIQNERGKSIAQACGVGLSGGYFVFSMRNQKLMGQNFALFMIAIHSLGMIGMLMKGFSQRSTT